MLMLVRSMIAYGAEHADTILTERRFNQTSGVRIDEGSRFTQSNSYWNHAGE